MKTETIMLNKERNVTLTAYLLDVKGEFSNIPKRPAVLVLPGGGYSMCSEREADPVALAYLNAGFHAFVLRYSVGKDATWPNPLQDYEQAMELMTSMAEEWNLYTDKIAVVGFSAGGHLAACAATMAQHKPCAAILGYAVTEEKTAQACLPGAPDVIRQVNGDTCPCFVFASRTDNVVPVSNSVRFISALSENGVMFENHIYAYGPHGFSTADSSTLMPETGICSRALNWTRDSIEWLGDMWGVFAAGTMTEPKCQRRMNGNHAPYLSVDCTIGFLMEVQEAKEIIAPVLEEIGKHMMEQYGGGHTDTQGAQGNMFALLSGITLKDLMASAKIPDSAAEEMNQQLTKIKNR